MQAQAVQVVIEPEVVDPEMEDPALDPDQLQAAIEDELRGIVERLTTLANDQVSRKSDIERRWLEDLRAFHGRYDAVTLTGLTESKRSRAFVKLTRKKTNAWQARLQELLFPTDDRNWAIQPTPVPTLTKQAAQAARIAEQKVQEANAAGPDTPEGVDLAAQAQAAAAGGADIQKQIDEAKKRSDAMQEEMDDQLTECLYPAEARDMIQDACRLGAGIIKGPMTSDRGKGSWRAVEKGGITRHVFDRPEENRPVFRRVDPWAYFPDMSAMRPEDVEFDLERHLWTKRDLRRMAKEGGFNPAAVRRLLEERQQDFTMVQPGLSYLADLRSITGSGDPVKGRYVGWEYHGPLECRETAMLMRAMALSSPDPAEREAGLAEADEYEATGDVLDERRVIIHFCEGEVLKVAPEYPLDSGESLYSVFPFEPSESSIFGYGVPNIMNDSQRAINGGWRAALDNMALSVGPQIVVDKEGIEPQDKSWVLTPRKVWLKVKAAVGAAKPFEVYNIPNNVNEILTIVREARQHADDEVAMPVMSEGEAPEGPDQTATAIRALSAGSNVTFRRVVKAYDDGVTTPCMRRLYDWNMQFSQREDIKGDMKIDARGVAALMAQEAQSAMLMGIAANWPNNPVIAPAVNLYGVLRKALQASRIDPSDVLVSKDEYDQNVAAAAKAAAEGGEKPPAVVAAEMRLQVAQLEGDNALKIEGMRMQTEQMKLAQQYDMSIEQLKAMLAGKEMEIGHKERQFQAEAGIERMNAEEARARGERPTGSGGSLSTGTIKA